MNVGNLTLEDFVKAGWNANDVKEILQLSKDEKPTPETTPDNTDPTPDNTNPTPETTPENTNPTPDNALQEELNKMREELLRTQKALATAQAVNRNQNFGDNKQKTDEEIFADFIQSY